MAAIHSDEFNRDAGQKTIRGMVFPANGRIERCNGRIEAVLQLQHFRSGEALETTLHRYVALYNQQLPQSALASRTPLQAMKDWHRLKPELFRKQPYYLTGCDTWLKCTILLSMGRIPWQKLP